MKNIILIFCFFTICSILHGQDTWDLERCIRHALEHSLEIEAAELTNETNAVNLRQSRHARYPSLNLGSNLGWNFGRAINPSTNDFETENSLFHSISASTGLPLYAGGNITKSIQQAEKELTASREDLQQTKNNIALNVATAYLAILFADENLKNAQSRLALVEKQLEQTRKLIEAGSRPKSEEYQFLAEVATTEMDVVNYENQYAQNMLNLKHQLRLEPGFPLQIEKPAIDLDAVDKLETSAFEAVYNAALGSQPQIRASALRMEGAEIGISLAKASYTPSLNLGASIGTNFSDLAQQVTGFTTERTPVPGVYINGEPVTYEVDQVVPTGLEEIPYTTQLDNNLGYGISLSLSIPIYNNDRVRSSVDRAKLNYARAVNSDEQIKQLLKTDVQNALSQARSARKALDAAQRSFDANEVAFENMETRYNIGSANTYEYLQARNGFDQAEVNLTVAKYDYLFRIKILEYYLGRGMTLD